MGPYLIETLGILALVLGATALVGTGAVVGGIWYGIRRITRSRKLRRTVDRGSTTVRAIAGDSSMRRLAVQQLKIEQSLDATAQAVEAAREASRPLGQLPDMAAELRVVGEGLSQQLRVAQAEPSSEVRAHLAEELEVSSERFLRVAADLRAATVTGGYARSTAELDQLEARLAVEVDALQAWDEVYGRARRRVQGGN